MFVINVNCANVTKPAEQHVERPVLNEELFNANHGGVEYHDVEFSVADVIQNFSRFNCMWSVKILYSVKCQLDLGWIQSISVSMGISTKGALK